jgi:hypothetical protein
MWSGEADGAGLAPERAQPSEGGGRKELEGERERERERESKGDMCGYVIPPATPVKVA